MKVLITGASGQVGQALMRSVPAGIAAVGCDRAGLDVCDLQAVAGYLERSQPQVVINCAAYTKVDLAESEPRLAHAINAEAVGHLACLCREMAIRLVHVSTDFVFDGRSGHPYRPEDRPNPLNVYGASKLEGERQIEAQAGLEWRIVRSAWIHSAAGQSFVRTMLRLFRERSSVSVVADQVGTPTSAHSLAQCLWAAAQDGGPPGILHFTDAGVCSWYDFAVAIYEEATALGFQTAPVAVVPIGSDEYPAPARRPSFSVLDTRATVLRLGLLPVHWRRNLRESLKELTA